MGFFKIIESELNSIVQIVTGSNSSTKTGISTEEKEKLQGMLSNIKSTELLMDVAQKKVVSERVNEKEVQEAIKKFNSLPLEERRNIIENADSILQNKLIAFMDANAKYTDSTDGTNYMLQQVLDKTNNIAKRKSYTEKEMAVLVKDFQKLFAKCNIETDRVMNAFVKYRGDAVTSGKVCENNKDEYAISLCSRFKQSMTSYNQLFVSNVQEILKASESSKSDFMHNLTRTLEKIQSEIEHFQTASRDVMNAFIPDVIQEENRFSIYAKGYVEKGIPADLSLPNKVVENAIIDAVLESYRSAAVNEAA